MGHVVGVLHCYANQIHAIGDAIRHPDPNGRRSACLDGIGRSRELKRWTRRRAWQCENANQDGNRYRDASNPKDTLLQLNSVSRTTSLSLIRRYGTSMIFFQKVSYHLPSGTKKSTTKTLYSRGDERGFRKKSIAARDSKFIMGKYLEKNAN